MSSNDFVQDLAEWGYIMEGGSGTGGITGAWADMENYDRMSIPIAVSDAAEALTVTLQQATDSAGTDAKALNVRRVWLMDATTKKYALATEEAAASYEIPANGAVTAIVEIIADDLDINNDFKAVQANIAGSTARTQSMLYVMRGARYKPAGETPAV